VALKKGPEVPFAKWDFTIGEGETIFPPLFRHKLPTSLTIIVLI